MNEYDQIISRAELTLNNGEYKKCIDLLKSILEYFPVSSDQGINIRMMLITALSGINKKEESIEICKELTKSKYNYVREEAKSLIQILNSPNLQIPDEWNIKFDNTLNPEEFKSTTPQTKSINNNPKYINTSYLPTGETKPFQKGFILLTFIFLVFLISLLSGCVKVENNLDLRKIETINFDLTINSKYLNKMPWQLNFEKKLQESSLSKNIFINKDNLVLRKEGLDIKGLNSYINQILNIASNSIGVDLKDIKVSEFENNFLIGKRYFYSIKLDLKNLENLDDLEIYMNVFNPSKVEIMRLNENVIISNNKISWKILPGEFNQVEFSFWHWNIGLISSLFIFFIIIISYIIKKKRYQLGSNLPQLPS
tara:strand:- start:2445 stop:3548 length:1104 start_codon:yes stop_codon:yes gene_type:complete